MDRLSRSGLVLIMLVGLLLPAGVSGQEAPASQAALRLVEADASRAIFEIDVPVPTVEEVQVEGQLFQRLSIPGYGAADAAGQPQCRLRLARIRRDAAGDRKAAADAGRRQRLARPGQER